VELPLKVVVGQNVVLAPLVVGKNVVVIQDDVGHSVHHVVLLPCEVVVMNGSSIYR
jgi:hypothetical protein